MMEALSGNVGGIDDELIFIHTMLCCVVFKRSASQLRKLRVHWPFVIAKEGCNGLSESVSSEVLCVSRAVSPESRADMMRLLTFTAATLSPPKVCD